MKLIAHLPDLLYGVDIEIRLFEEYQIQTERHKTYISPFQFEVTYSPPTNLIEIEKITITLNSVVLEGEQWKIESIVSDDEQKVLLNVIENLKGQAYAEL